MLSRLLRNAGYRNAGIVAHAWQAAVIENIRSRIDHVAGFQIFKFHHFLLVESVVGSTFFLSYLVRVVPLLIV